MRRIANERALLPLSTLSRAPPGSLCCRARPRGLPRLYLLEYSYDCAPLNFLLRPRCRKVKRGDRDAGEQELEQERERRARRTWLDGPGVSRLPESQVRVKAGQPGQAHAPAPAAAAQLPSPARPRLCECAFSECHLRTPHARDRGGDSGGARA